METYCTFADKRADTGLHNFLRRFQKMVPCVSDPMGGIIDTVYVLFQFEPLPKTWHIHKLYIIAPEAVRIRVIWLVCQEEVQ